MPVKAKFASMALLFLVAAGCGGAGREKPIATYSVTGTVSGAVASKVTVTLNGASSTTTDAAGSFSFGGLSNGSYTVTPSLIGYTFTPASLVATVSGANVSSLDFSASAEAIPAYSISGTVSGELGAGTTITMSLTGASSATTTTDASPSYTFSGLSSGVYTVTPSLAGHGFNPASLTVTLNGANLTGADFTAVALTHSISGTVSGVAPCTVPPCVASPVVVMVSGTMGTGIGSTFATPDSSGNYSIGGLIDGNRVTLSPLGTGYTFSPASRSVTVAGANVVGQDFTATATP